MTKSVLLIEDEPNIIEAIRFLLERAGFTVAEHSDGATAFDKINALKPDLVVLDLMLPGKSGLQILEEIRAATPTVNLPVLMLTAKGQRRDREAAENAGVSKFITKPFSNDDIVASVKSLLAI
jgi:DNA-binding response OmpR family regulator